MKTTHLSADSASSVSSQAKNVMGVVADHGELEQLSQALDSMGVNEIEVLQGNRGREHLNRSQHSVEGFLNLIFGDLESEMRLCYLQEIERGRLVFAVPVTGDNADDVVRAAQELGVKHLARFGTLVNESFEQPPLVPVAARDMR